MNLSETLRVCRNMYFKCNKYILTSNIYYNQNYSIYGNYTYSKLAHKVAISTQIPFKQRCVTLLFAKLFSPNLP